MNQTEMQGQGVIFRIICMRSQNGVQEDCFSALVQSNPYYNNAICNIITTYIEIMCPNLLRKHMLYFFLAFMYEFRFNDAT